MTSVAFMRAAAVCPAFSCISRAELAVIMDVICWSPIEILTSAISPLIAGLRVGQCGQGLFGLHRAGGSPSGAGIIGAASASNAQAKPATRISILTACFITFIGVLLFSGFLLFQSTCTLK
jgi:hypothetical protein